MDTKPSRARLGLLYAPLAVVLHLLIVDAAVEAVVSGVRGRWWVVGVAAGFLVASGVLWSRSSWRSRTATATLVLLGLFGLAAFLGEGMADQLRLLGQAPPAGTAVILALGVALAGLAVVRVAGLPLWARGATGILAIYGVVAFVLPVATDAAYPSLLGGEALWPWQPNWLEGGFVGSFLVLPAGLLALLVAAVRGFRGVDRWRAAFELVALGLCGLLTVESFTLAYSPRAVGETSAVLAESRPAVASETRAKAEKERREAASPTPREDGQRPVLGESDGHRRPRGELAAEPVFPVVAPAEARATVDALFDEASRLRSGIDRESFDLDAVLARTGTNLESIFRWVRTNTRPLPYRGVLKGARGTLMDRGGNSLDRSLLLAELLQRAGHNVRLANAPLSPKGRAMIEARVLESLSQRSSSPRTEPEESEGLAAEVERLAVLSGQDPVQVVAYSRELEKRGRAVRQAVLEQADRQTEALIATVDLEKGGLSPLEAALPALQDHWWVEVMDPPELALDLYFDQREEGLEAQGLGSTPKSYAIEAIPATLFHTVTISVLAEQSSGESIRSRPALSETFRVAELGLETLTLGFMPSWKEGSVEEVLDHESDSSPSVAFEDSLLKALDLKMGWTPALRVGEEVHVDSTIGPDGSVGSAQALLGTGQALGSALSGLQALGDAGSDLSGPSLRQVVTKVELRSPDGRISHARTLFDERAVQGDSPGATGHRERNARFLSTQSFVIQTGEVSSAFLADTQLEATLGMRTAIRRLIASAEAGDRAETLKRVLSLGPPVNPAQQLAELRFGALGLQRSSVVASANVLSSFVSVSFDGEANRVVSGLDILDNQVLPLVSEADEARRVNVYQGVLDTLLEDAVLGFLPERTNAALFFGRDGASTREGRSAWRMASSSVGAQLYPDAAHRLSDRQNGQKDDTLRIVYSPTRRAAGAADAPFWRVDTRTGATVGLDSEGRGSVYAEFLVYLNNFLTLWNAALLGPACAEALVDGGDCAYQSCIYRAASLSVGLGAGFIGLGSGIAKETVAAAGILYKVKAFVIGHVLSDNCES